MSSWVAGHSQVSTTQLYKCYAYVSQHFVSCFHGATTFKDHWKATSKSTEKLLSRPLRSYRQVIFEMAAKIAISCKTLIRVSILP